MFFLLFLGHPVNIRGASKEWHEIRIAPTIPTYFYESQMKRRQIRTQLFQRCIYLLLRDAILAPCDGVLIERSLIFLCINKIVADQPKERGFLALKGAQSYMDCSLCLMTSKTNPIAADIDSSVTEFDGEYTDPGEQNISLDSVGHRKISGPQARFRDPRKTVRAQLILADRYRHNSIFHDAQYSHEIPKY